MHQVLDEDTDLAAGYRLLQWFREMIADARCRGSRSTRFYTRSQTVKGR